MHNLAAPLTVSGKYRSLPGQVSTPRFVFLYQDQCIQTCDFYCAHASDLYLGILVWDIVTEYYAYIILTQVLHGLK